MSRAKTQLESQYVGQRAVWHPKQNIGVLCRVIDARDVRGREELLLTPVVGTGKVWVASRMVSYVRDCEDWPEKSKVHLFDAASDLLYALRRAGRDFAASLPPAIRTKMLRLDDALEPESYDDPDELYADLPEELEDDLIYLPGPLDPPFPQDHDGCQQLRRDWR